MEMEWDFADRLERARVWRGWTQTELARRAGVHQVQVHKLLHGRKPRVQGETDPKIGYSIGRVGELSTRPLRRYESSTAALAP